MKEYIPKGPYNRIRSTELMYTRACKDAELVYVDDTVQAPFSVIPHMSTMSYENPTMRQFARFGSYVEEYPNQNFAKLSPRHGRSLLNLELSGTGFWEDTYGIPFSAIDLKGSIANDVTLDAGVPSSYNVRTNGLYELTYTVEAPEASRRLRSIGLPTEVYAKVWKLTSIPTDHGHISVNTLKRKFRLKALLHAYGLPLCKADISKDNVYQYLESTEYALLERHTQVPVRVQDLIYPRSRDDLFCLLNPVFTFINSAYAEKKRSILPGFPAEQHLDIYSQSDIYYYIMEKLPKTMGAYMAIMHNNDLLHGYPSKQNWSLLGTICDLDSVDGPGVNPGFDEDLNGAKYRDLAFMTRGMHRSSIAPSLTGLVHGSLSTSEGTFFRRVEESYREHIRL